MQSPSPKPAPFDEATQRTIEQNRIRKTCRHLNQSSGLLRNGLSSLFQHPSDEILNQLYGTPGINEGFLGKVANFEGSWNRLLNFLDNHENPEPPHLALKKIETHQIMIRNFLSGLSGCRNAIESLLQENPKTLLNRQEIQASFRSSFKQVLSLFPLVDSLSRRDEVRVRNAKESIVWGAPEKPAKNKPSSEFSTPRANPPSPVAQIHEMKPPTIPKIEKPSRPKPKPTLPQRKAKTPAEMRDWIKVNLPTTKEGLPLLDLAEEILLVQENREEPFMFESLFDVYRASAEFKYLTEKEFRKSLTDLRDALMPLGLKLKGSLLPLGRFPIRIFEAL